MNKLIMFLLVGGIAFVASGCATIVHGVSTRVTVNSNPQGATATVGNQSIVTPGQVIVKNNKISSIEIKKEGYKTSTVYLEQQMSGWVWGNLLVGGFIGLGIDYVSGGAYKIEPTDVNVTLEPASNS